MPLPNFNYENRLIKSGYGKICGLDEVGRGPLAGPVVASAVIIDAKLITSVDTFDKIKDSKKLSQRQREKWFKFLTGIPEIKYGIGIISERVIDKINVLEATKNAMQQALDKLGITPDFLLIDGNFTLEKIDLNQKAIPQGDAKVISIAAASIIAKVTRDRIMSKYGEIYPRYNFAKHKGYGTALHVEMIRKYGPCAIHRRSFEPIKSLSCKKSK